MAENHLHDAELLRRLAEGEPAAFAAVYHQFYQRIYNFSKTYLPDKEDAEDVTADTFVKLWNRRDTFTTLGNVKSFLHVTARNGCFDFLRHLKIKTLKQAELVKQLELNQDTDQNLIEVRNELNRLIQSEVEKMSEKMKEIFHLSYEVGLTPAQIAANLQISVQTVSNQKTSALNSLRKALATRSQFIFLLILSGAWRLLSC